MSDLPSTANSASRWGGASLLKVMLIAQCALGVLVVIADLPGEFLSGLPGATPRSPEIDIPIAPGNQTRRFEPDRVTRDLPATPGFSVDETMPSRLEFTENVEGLPDGAVLLNGTIADGDAKRFADWLQQRPDLPLSIALNSPGGSVSDALAIGRLIRDRDLPVVIASGSICFSACPYVLAGGTERAVSSKAFVGVHQHYFGENTYLPAFLLVSDIQSGQGEVMVFLDEMGIDPMMMATALMTPPEDIYILLPAELEAFRLATDLTE